MTTIGNARRSMGEAIAKSRPHPTCVPELHAAKKKSAATTTALLRVNIERLRKRYHIQVEDAGVGAREHDGVGRVEQIELLHALHRGDRFVSYTSLFSHRLGDAFRGREAVGRNLHHPAAVI